MNHLSDGWRGVTGSILDFSKARGRCSLLRMPTFLIPFGLATVLFLATAFWVSPPAQEAQEIAIPTPARSVTTVVAIPPTLTPTVEIRPSPTVTRVPASLPTRDPAFAMALSTSTPSPVPTPRPIWTPTPTPRKGCDPAYPDERTCIPPGPPFNQGCAITAERNFTVLPPDPQHLDADKDGIGCEPIKGKP